LFAIVMLVNSLTSMFAAPLAVDPSGHWEGSIQAPDVQVAVAIDLAKNSSGQFVGTFTEPERGLKGLPLAQVTIEDRSIKLVLRGGQGGGTFNATLSEDNRSMTGEFVMNEGGYVLPFTLTRTGDANIVAPPRSPAIAKELAATWQGTADVGGKPLRIIVTMTNHPDGTATGTVMSPEGGGMEIPIAIAQRSDTITLEVPAVGASFAAVINADKTELTGTWTQGSAALPLTLRRTVN
jgi:hypothetical protein